MDETTATSEPEGTTEEGGQTQPVAAPASPTQPAPAPAKSQPATTGEDWKKRFGGLQSSYNNLDARFKALEADAKAKDDELTTLKKEQSDRDAALLENDVFKLQLATYRTIAEKFTDKAPTLLQMEAKGLLPAISSVEEIETTLTAFVESISNLQTTSSNNDKKNFKAGAGPDSPPTPKGEETPESLQKEANEAFKAGNTALYNQLTDKRFALLAKR